MSDESDVRGRLTQAVAGEPLLLAVLFGSRARGTAHAESDIDLAVLPLDGAMPLAADLALEARLTAACRREVQVVRLDQANALVRWQVARDGRLIKGARREYLRFVVAAAREHADLAPAWDAGGRTFRRRLAELR